MQQQYQHQHQHQHPPWDQEEGGGGGHHPDEALAEQVLHAEEWHDGSWRPPANLDLFFSQVYAYFTAGGFRALLLSRLLNLLTLAFTILFSTFLLVYVDWHALVRCTDKDSCRGVVGLRRDALSNPTAAEGVVFLYFGVFALYWMVNLLSFLYDARTALEMRALYRRLGIPERDLPTLEWFAVVDRLVALQDEVPLCVVKKLTALDITNRIMRKDNYLVAMVNTGVLDTRLPFCLPEASRRRPTTSRTAAAAAVGFADGGTGSGTSTGSGGAYLSMQEVVSLDDLGDGRRAGGSGGSGAGLGPAALGDRFPQQEYYSRQGQRRGSDGAAAVASALEGDPLASVWSAFGSNMEWNLRFCVLHAMFDSQFRVRRGFVSERGVRSLQRRFFWMGVLNFVLMPFIMIFMVIFFLLRHAEEFRSKKDLLGRREWSPLALLRLREFNELGHHFRERLAGTHGPAAEYVNQFPSTVTSAVAEFVAYVSGAFVAVMLLLAFVDSAILLNIEVGNRALIWWLTIFTIVLALSRSLVADRNAVFRPNEAMERVVEFTHYMPPHWWGRCHTFEVLDEFEALYATKVVTLLREVLSVVMAPFVLCFTLPRCAGQVVEFVRTSTTYIDGVGDVCAHAMFELDELGDREYGGGAGAAPQQGGGDGRARGGSGADTNPRARAPRARGGKLEKSLLTFAINHPTWEPEPAGSRFLATVVQRGAVGGAAGGPPTADVLQIGEEMADEEDEVEVEEEIEIGDEPDMGMTDSNMHLMGSFSQLLRAMPPAGAAPPGQAGVPQSRMASSSHLFAALERSAHYG